MTIRDFPQLKPNSVRPNGKQLSDLLLAHPVSRFDREVLFESWIDDGFAPDFLASFVEIPMPLKDGRILSVYVAPDYLCVGTDDDHIRVPLFPLTAQRIADKLGCVLPTTKLVDAIWKAGVTKLPPQPWGPPYDSSMMSDSRIIIHNQRIQSKIPSSHVLGSLLVGHKKDVVICESLALRPKQVYIYGWHQQSGKPIQPLYGGHENTYCDYSHGIRLIAREANIVDKSGASSLVDIKDVYMDPVLAAAVSSEGKLSLWRQPFVNET